MEDIGEERGKHRLGRQGEKPRSPWDHVGSLGLMDQRSGGDRRITKGFGGNHTHSKLCKKKFD